jgi:AraC-like DNA-binding protein
MRHGGAKLQRTARRLGISGRSLQRRLSEMGTSYSVLVAEVRLDTASHLLVESDERIADISARLGFSSASSFIRTFMRWMDIPPGAYRRQQCEKSARHRRRGKPAARRPLPTSE